ncbi:MAG TPA: hypothetical protein VFA57_09610 [Pseudolabrys sp.]|jgi:hypothetical protein|nr:hypothetical protein [Pseudolabrys sp.]
MSNRLVFNRLLGRSARQTGRDVTAGEIVVALCWLLLVAALVATPWVRDAIALVATQVPPGML